MIPLTLVTSSQIEAVGHDPDNLVLAIRFKTGALYHYQNFTASDFFDLMEAESVGSYFYKHIKHNPTKYPYQKQ